MDKFGSVVAGHMQGCWDVVGQIHSAVCNYDQINVMKKQFAGFQTTTNWWEFRFPKNNDGIVIFNGKWVFPRHVSSKHWLPDMSKFSLPDLELGGFVQELGTKWVKRMALIRSVPQPSKSIEKPLSDPIPEWNFFFGCYCSCTKSRTSWNGNVEIYWVLYPASHSQLQLFDLKYSSVFHHPQGLGRILGTHHARTPKAPPKNLPLPQACERLTSSQTATLPLSRLYIRFEKDEEEEEEDDDDDDDDAGGRDGCDFMIETNWNETQEICECCSLVVFLFIRRYHQHQKSCEEDFYHSFYTHWYQAAAPTQAPQAQPPMQMPAQTPTPAMPGPGLPQNHGLGFPASGGTYVAWTERLRDIFALTLQV